MSENVSDQNSSTETEGGKTNLIVNYLPQNLSDIEFSDLFASIGPITTARVIRDKQTGYSYGYGFVDYANPEDAAKAILKLDKHKMQHKVLKVAYSKPSGTQTKNINLYVSGLPPECDEAVIKKVFSKFGDIVQCNVIKDKNTKLCQGICFVLFTSRDQAETAIRTLSGQQVEELGNRTITIKFAKNEQRSQGYSSFLQSFSRGQHHPNLLQVPNRSLIPSLGGGGGFNGASPIRGIPRLMKERYSPIAPGGGSYHFHNAQAAAAANYLSSGAHAAAAFNFPGNNGDQSSRGKVVFVYGIGPFCTEEALRTLFSPAGRIVTVNVIIDTARGIGKGYGFVTFSTEKEANEAVRCLDKVAFQGRQLQVSIKS